MVEESENNDDCPLALNSSLIRLFDVPTLNVEANAYQEFTSFDSYQQKPRTISSLADTEIEECLKKLLVLHYLYAIAILWSGSSNLLRKRQHKLKDLINNEMSHSTKTKSLKLTKTCDTNQQFK